MTKLNQVIPQLIKDDEVEGEYEPMYAALHDSADLEEIMLDGRLAYNNGKRG